MSLIIIAGLTTGSIYALAAVGLVLTYKTSGIFNFAHGALASLSAFIFYYLRQERGLAWPLAAIAAVLLGGVVVGFLLEVASRRLANASLSMKVLATTGLLLVIQGGIQLAFPAGPDREVKQFLPTRSFDIAGVPITAAQMIIFGLGVGIVVCLTVFLRRARIGIAMRGVVEDAVLMDVVGISPARVRRFAWIIGSSLASMCGVLLAPLLPLDATTITFLVVTAFGAAAIGGFTNLPLTFAGGVAIGLGQAILGKYFSSSTGLAGGLASSLPFLVLFTVLVFAPRLRRPSVGVVRVTDRDRWVPPAGVRLGGGVVLLVFLALAPQFAGAHLLDWTHLLACTILFLSLGLLARTSGQVSLGHIGFMAIGVTAFSHASDHGWPWLTALLFAGAVAIPIGALLAIPAIRFPGLYLALATLGFGLTLQQMFYSQDFMFGSVSNGLSVPRPSWTWLDPQSDKGYYYVLLVLAGLAAALTLAITGSRLGRLLRAMSDSPAGLRASGASINVSRVLVFCISAALAAMAGALDGAVNGIVGGDGYPPIVSLQLFVLVILSPGGIPWYAVMAAAGQVLIPSYLSTSGETVTNTLTVLFGAGAIAMSIAPPAATSTPALLRRLVDRLRIDRLESARRADARARRGPGPDRPTVSVGGAGLAVTDMTVRYGGVTAVDAVSLRAPVGKITGLIGPNGAGKSTIFNACSGIARPASGGVALHDADLRRLGQPARARLGLGRTFQQMELFDSLTVAENVALGCEARFAAWNPCTHLLAGAKQRRSVEARSAEAISLCGIREIRGQTVGSLSTGQRRLVELARCIAGSYEILLLDEPSSGLDHVETVRFGKVLKTVVAERGVGILLVEHDMTLVNDLCDHVYVIDFGKPIFDGTVAEIAASSVVRNAYLGDELVEAGSGTARQERMA